MDHKECTDNKQNCSRSRVNCILFKFDGAGQMHSHLLLDKKWYRAFPLYRHYYGTGGIGEWL